MLETAIMCMATNIYHEARGEPVAGRVAVAQVVLNRVKAPQFPNTICGVVHQGKYHNGHPVRYKCHFSWWCDGKSDRISNYEEWGKARSVAEVVLLEGTFDITENSLYYHSTLVAPYWVSHYQKTVQINNHIFYR